VSDEKPRELPEGWAWKKLGEVCEINPRASEDEIEPTTPVTFVPMESVDATSGTINQARVRPYREVQTGFTRFRGGDVIFAKITPCMENGKSAVVPSLKGPFGVGSTEFVVFRPREGMLAVWVHTFLRQATFRHEAKQNMPSSVGQARVPIDFLSDALIPAPKIDEQHRILETLIPMLARVAETRASLERVKKNAARARRSVLAAAIHGVLTAAWRESKKLTGLNLDQRSITKIRRGVPQKVSMSDEVDAWEVPDAWAKMSVSDLLRRGWLLDVKDGNHGANHPTSSELGEQGLPFIMAREVKRFRIDYDGAKKITGAPLDRIRVGIARPDDVILTHKGSVGQVAVADRRCVLTPQTTYYRCEPARFDARFVMYAFASPFLQDQLKALSEQTTRDFAPISEQYRLFLPVCVLDEQREIVRILDRWFAALDGVEQRVDRGLTACDRLRESLLNKAFRGELLPRAEPKQPVPTASAKPTQLSLPGLDDKR
jgi:type I restriction enzyme, S subunit